MLAMSLCAVKLFYWSRVKAGTVGFLSAAQRLYDVSSHCYGDKAETDVPNSSNLPLLVWIQFVFLSGCSSVALWPSISHAGNSPHRLPSLLPLPPPHLSAPSCVFISPLSYRGASTRWVTPANLWTRPRLSWTRRGSAGSRSRTSCAAPTKRRSVCRGNWNTCAVPPKERWLASPLKVPSLPLRCNFPRPTFSRYCDT